MLIGWGNDGQPHEILVDASGHLLLASTGALLGLSTGAGTVDATTLRVTTASDGPLNTAIGGVNDAAVDGDAAGSVNGHLRGIGKKLAASIAVTLATAPAGTDTMDLIPNGTQADQRLTVDATVGGVQFSALHADTLWLFWTCEDAQCRVTVDGSAPTASNGHIINPGDSGVWAKALATAAKFIRTGATSATIHASQMK